MTQKEMQYEKKKKKLLLKKKLLKEMRLKRKATQKESGPRQATCYKFIAIAL